MEGAFVTTSEPTTQDDGGTASATPPARLPQSKEEVRARREELRAALIELEDALSGPAGDPDHWARRVEAGIERMHQTLRTHISDTEAEGGMLPQVEEDAPWLEGRVELLRSEHADLHARTEQLLAHCRDGDVEQVRDEALELLRAISRHRQRGTDLLWDAYMVDISAAD